VIGNRGRADIDARELMSRRADIVGVMLGHARPDELTSIHAALRAGLENKTLCPYIGKEWPLAEASEAHRAVMGEAQGKHVLIP
jgi:NADPH2:quinone reductase